MIEKGWIVRPVDDAQVNPPAASMDLSPITAAVLWGRGVRETGEAQSWLVESSGAGTILFSARYGETRGLASAGNPLAGTYLFLRQLRRRWHVCREPAPVVFQENGGAGGSLYPASLRRRIWLE